MEDEQPDSPEEGPALEITCSGGIILPPLSALLAGKDPG